MPRFPAVASGPFIVLRQRARSSSKFDRKDYKLRCELAKLASPVIHLHEYSERQFRLRSPSKGNN